MVFRRNQSTTAEVASRAKGIGQELNESVDHLRQAAIAAREAFTPSVGQRVDAAKGAMKPTWESMIASLAPIMAAASESQESGRKAVKMSRKQLRSAVKTAKREAAKATGQRRRRWPYVVGGALLIGTAAGVAGALMRKRASRSEWEEYGTGTSRSTSSTIKAKAGQTQEKIAETASHLKDKVTSSSGSSGTGGFGDSSSQSQQHTTGTGGRPTPAPGVGQGTVTGNFSRPN
jgi:hypothetical protein